MSKDKKILLIIIFNLIIVFAELIFGFISNSFSLIADALHNAGDVVAVVITYVALKITVYKTTFKHTFGFLKAEMMAAFINTSLLYLTMLFLIYHAIGKISNPEIIAAEYMIIVGFIALVANSISAYILHTMNVPSCSSGHCHSHHHHNEDANIKSAYLHMFADALISVGVVIAGIFIYFFKIYNIDAILTIIFSIYILHHSYPLLKKSFLSLLDFNLTKISKDDLDKIILIKHTDIFEYHDLHIHTPSSKYNFISFHIVLKDNTLTFLKIEAIIKIMKDDLRKEGFNNIQIEIDSMEGAKNCINWKI